MEESRDDAGDDERLIHFCSTQCRTTWKETIRNVSVAH